MDRKGSSVRRELVLTCREKEQEQKSQAKVLALGPHGVTTVRGWAGFQDRCRTAGPAGRDDVYSTWKPEIEILLPASYLYLPLSLDLGPGTCQFSSAVPSLSGLSFCPSVCPVTSITSVSICFFLCNDLGLCLWTFFPLSFLLLLQPPLHSLHPFPVPGL